MRSIIMTVLVFMAATASACGPEDSFAKYGGGFPGIARGGGGFDPRLAAAQQMMGRPVAVAQVARHHQILAAQAAAYRARRAPIKYAKAVALREYNLAKRAEKQAWVLAKQEEWQRKKALEASPNESESPDAGRTLLASIGGMSATR